MINNKTISKQEAFINAVNELKTKTERPYLILNGAIIPTSSAVVKLQCYCPIHRGKEVSNAHSALTYIYLFYIVDGKRIELGIEGDEYYVIETSFMRKPKIIIGRIKELRIVK